MIQVECIVCGKIDYVWPSRAKTYKTCSRECMGIQAIKTPSKQASIVCDVCGRPFKVKQSHADKRRTCSMECCGKLRSEKMIGSGNHQYGIKGSLNSSWKGGRSVSSHGYIRVRHESATNNDGVIFEHRLVMEEYMGRKLHANEVVHHINGIKTDNRAENLKLMTLAEHTSAHNVDRDQSKDKKTGRFISE